MTDLTYRPEADPFLVPGADQSNPLDDVDPRWGLGRSHHDHPLNREARLIRHLNDPLVVFTAVDCCGRDHELHVVTDGRRIYACGGYTGAVDCLGATREGSKLTIPCGQPIRGGEDSCPEEIVVDLADDGWVQDANQIEVLARYGVPVDVA